MKKSTKKMLLGCLTTAVVMAASAVSAFAAKGEDVLENALKNQVKAQQEEGNTLINDTKKSTANIYFYQTAASKNSIKIAFNGVSGAKKYAVSYMRAADTKASGKWTSTTTCTLNGLKENTTYYMMVFAYDAEGYNIGESRMDTAVTTPGKPSLRRTDSYYSNKKMNFLFKNHGTAEGYRIRYTDYKTKKTRTYYSGYSSAYIYFPTDTYCKVMINGYVTCNKKKVYGPAYTTYLCQQPKCTKKSNTRSSMTFKWPKVTSASNYSVYISTKPNSGYKKVKTTTGTTYTYKNMKKGRKYYMYVRANKKVGGKTYSSPFTSYYYMVVY